ncbi:poly-gamma-glutamate hydrolase family protein [Streptomyces griseoaurantiacus]|uniref:poly-gamma-glutamate hydrolase family protein n=1 Tax=Streptomyces griseoaurantiacus TaxID=68213 RepID=UPI0036C9B29E
MADLYPNYAALAAARQIGVDYRVLVRTPPGSRLAHIAVHGGGIEPGTTEVADYLAGSGSRFYSFDAMLASGNDQLHLDSVNFDEPQALDLVAASDYVISWHGVSGTDQVTYVGGLDGDIAARVMQSLEQAGFTVAPGNQEGNGTSTSNIANRGARSMGVQMELSQALRESFFEDFTRAGRDSGTRTSNFYAYMTAVQTALNGLDVPGKAEGSVWAGQAAQPVKSTGTVSGDFGIPALAPLTIDGMPLDSVKEALRLASTRQASTASERFWSSPPRANGDRAREVFEFSLSAARPVNRIGFALARFPQRAWVQWRGADGVWRPLQNARTGGIVQISIMDSLPAIIPSGVASEVKLHPQHFGAGHWMPQLVDVEPVTASRFRVIMTRLPSSSAPRGSDGEPVDYSLGVKDAAVSYRAASLEDLPWLPQRDAEYSAPIAGSTDLLGSQVNYLLRRNRAANLTPPAQGIWRCAPQPVPNAVVSLYLDLRTSAGQGQVIDRLYVDPVTSGPSVNLYYTDETVVPERFAPSDAPLTLPLVRAASDTPTADSEGLLFETARSYLDVDNRACQWDPAAPFLLAMTVNPQFTPEDAGQWTVLDSPAFSIWFEDGSLNVRLGERIVEMEPVNYSVNSRYPLAVAYDGETLTVRTPWETRIQQHANIPDQAPPTVIRLGGPLQGEGGSLRLRSLLLARGRAGDIDGIDAYWQDPTGYVLSPGYTTDPTAHTSASAILRMDPSLITAGQESVCPWGLIGGAPVAIDDLVWTPVPGDFKLRKGLLKFRPIKARHVKMEFTNLQPISITPSQASPLVETRLFPESGTTARGVVATGTAVSGAAPVGARVATDQGAVYQYVDANRIVSSTSSGDAPYLPTEALYAPDPLAAQQLRRSGQRFPYMPLPGTKAPRFTSTGTHRYQVVQLAMDTKVAYSVALSQVLAYLADPVAERDTEQYVELFHDTAYLSGYSDDEHGGWKHTGSAMVTTEQPVWTGTRMTSKTFISKRRVLAVQFAAQASDAKQLVQDPDFDDQSLHAWRAVGDATIDSSDQYASTIGRMARVARGHAASSWGALEARFPTWGDLEDSDPLPNRPLWWEVENSTNESDFGGIESLRPVTPAPGGRLYAAVRVYTEGPLAQPLALQLVNGDGRILAESDQMISAAQVAEWYVGATVRTSAPVGTVTWDTVTNGNTRNWSDMETLGLWGDITQDWDMDNIYDVRVRLIQQGAAGTGAWLVDSLAIYNDPIIWEISRDGGVTWHEMLGIRNNPRGVFQFPDLPPSDRSGGTQLRWRATGYAPDLSVSSVVLRPWYATMSGAVPYMDTLQSAGAEQSLADYYPPADSDPLFQGWQHPIPEDWWLTFRQWMRQNAPKTEAPPSITLPDAVAEGTDEGNPPSASRTTFTDAFVLNR